MSSSSSMVLNIVQSKLSRDTHAQEKVGLAFKPNPDQISICEFFDKDKICKICQSS